MIATAGPMRDGLETASMMAGPGTGFLSVKAVGRNQWSVLARWAADNRKGARGGRGGRRRRTRRPRGTSFSASPRATPPPLPRLPLPTSGNNGAGRLATFSEMWPVN